jgi:hypothetical protein
MIKLFRKHVQQNDTTLKSSGGLLDDFILTQRSVNSLPDLSPVEKVQLEQDIAISHLYNSSKIEGTSLNTERLSKAINA